MGLLCAQKKALGLVANVTAGSWAIASTTGDLANHSGAATGILASATLAASPEQATLENT